MKKDIESWLLEGPTWIKFAVERQLLNMTVSPEQAIKSPEIDEMIKWLIKSEDGIRSIVEGTASYKKEGFWYLYFLSDIGFTSRDLSLQNEFQEIMKLQNEKNRFLLSKEMKPDYFCISSLLLTAIVRMSGACKEEIRPHIEMLLSSQRLDGGWHCAQNRAIASIRSFVKVSICNKKFIIPEYVQICKRKIVKRQILCRIDCEIIL